MHPNPAFRTAGDHRNLAFARSRGFGMLAVNAASGPLLSHVPFLLTEDGTAADLHLVRSNPIARLLDAATPAVIAVTGPDGYVSPDWYRVDDQVPTWNYVAVHLRGRLERLPDTDLRRILDEVSDHFETRLAPKPVWKTAKMPGDLMAKMMRTLVPLRLHIETIEGTWKLNQNKPDAVRLSAADHVAADGLGTDTATLADLMRAPPA
ncbi:FMN-binding negative transcriptional regulator [Anianabacter salinae]|uniref:FMN-binding negative transcriptional regulator n=1 Tax=Anianabacter salinae TaxID=2851023 RepID=UPI00225DF535|nr:FMN-binding negative transcriptional regulator [Anianabacter salinae]MBV0913623.1 FMN-binding negative transcriptional regulator [Anianabacter salinae]